MIHKLVVVCLAALVSVSTVADDSKSDSDSDLERLLSESRSDGQDCIRLNAIRRTRVANDKTVLFYLNRDRIYMNALPRKCPGLRRQERFMYKTSLGRLCDLDTLTVLDNIGFGFSRGPSCGLGKFYPISKEDADALLERGNKTGP